jgi:dTDP-4-amino-4,6-dideoxygalactose transaminase
MEWAVPLADLDYGPEEEAAVLDVLRRRWLTMGAVTQEFEKQFAAFVGANYALAVSNATQALHLACLALGIGPGDEVIVPSLTFVATANAVLYTGASVRFADILDTEELTIDPDAIRAQITPHTKAILVMHYGGYPCRMPEIMRLAQENGLSVIEDAAHAPGASLNGIALGTWGDAGCFSFFSNKNLATGEGGMLVTNREDIAEKVRILRSHGMTSLTWDRHKGHAYTYDVVALGYNDRIDEMRSALGLAQLRKLPAGNERRKAITERYWQELAGCGATLPFAGLMITDGTQPSYHIFPILLPEGANRLAFINYMRSVGIQTSIHYPALHQFQYYRQLYGDIHLPLTEAVCQREVTLPLYPTMSDAQVQQVVQNVQLAIA